MSTFVYAQGAEEPSIRLPWQEEVVTAPGTWADLDLSTGFTFTLELTKGAATETPAATVTGGVGYVDITWAAGDLDIDPGGWRINLTATSGGRDRGYAPNSRPIVQVEQRN